MKKNLIIVVTLCALAGAFLLRPLDSPAGKPGDGLDFLSSLIRATTREEIEASAAKNNTVIAYSAERERYETWSLIIAGVEFTDGSNIGAVGTDDFRGWAVSISTSEFDGADAAFTAVLVELSNRLGAPSEMRGKADYRIKEAMWRFMGTTVELNFWQPSKSSHGYDGNRIDLLFRSGMHVEEGLDSLPPYPMPR